MERKKITETVLIALFAALIAAGTFIRIPLAPVPVVLSTLFVLLAVTCLPVFPAILSVFVYLFLGTAGLPIFTTGGGLAALLGPTGGYLIGLIPAVIIGSVMMKVLSSRQFLASVLSTVIATVLIYTVGLPWLSLKMDLPFTATLLSGLAPFIPGDVLKIIVAVAVTPVVRPRVKELLERE